jgi:hypothetical protein
MRHLLSHLKLAADTSRAALRTAIRGVRNEYELRRYLQTTGGIRVVSGAFAGMKYIRMSSGSAWAPKVLGTYELEVQAMISALDLRTYEAVIDVGCAEGYYLAGLGYLAKQCGHEIRLIGHDTNEQAVAIASYLMILNKISATIRPRCYEFGEHQSMKSLFIVDIEGGEENLFRDFQGSDWSTCDFLVEIHDKQGASARLDFVTSRLASSHNITVLSRRERELCDFPSHAVPAADKVKIMLMNEYREFGNKWVFAASRR